MQQQIIKGTNVLNICMIRQVSQINSIIYLAYIIASALLQQILEINHIISINNELTSCISKSHESYVGKFN